MSWIGLHKFADAIFEITQQLFYMTSSNLVTWDITNKGIFLNLFCNLKSDWALVPGPFVFDNFLHWKGLVSEEKIKLTFLGVFDNPLSKYLTFRKNFLHAMAVMGYLPRLKRGLRLAFGGAHFLHDFFTKIFFT